jgi:opacity protein-like surface antigen
MRLGFRVVLSFVFALAVAGVPRAHAQEPSWGDITVSAARIDYDLSGTGNTPGLAVRTTRRLTSNVSLEFGGIFAKPNQQFGPSTLFMPEAQLRYRWDVGRVSPYVGGGMGTALIKSDFHSEWDPTYSVASGAGVRLTDRLGLTGEFRLRVHEWRGGATTSELSTGLTWQLPSF